MQIFMTMQTVSLLSVAAAGALQSAALLLLAQNEICHVVRIFARYSRIYTVRYHTLSIFYGIMMNNPVVDTPDPTESSLQVLFCPF